jgi:uracil-DNA glycosylase family 4
MPSCTRCKLHEYANTVCLLGSGSAVKRVMIVGEAPGEEEDNQGKPFVGRSGQMLNEMLEAVGVDREEVYVTNAVHCRPPDNRTPDKKEIGQCDYWLKKEIAKVKPRFILTLGNVAVFALTGTKGIKELRGKPIEKKGTDLGLETDETVYVFPAYHPSYALRDPRNRPVLERDIAQFFELVRNGKPKAEEGLRVRIILSRDELEEAIEDIHQNDLLSWDTETSGLDPFAPGAWMTSFGVGTHKYQWCLPLNHPEGPIYQKFNTQKRWVKQLVTAMRGKTIVAQNGKFDSLTLRVLFGERLLTDFDTMLAHYQLDENSYHGLDHLASHYFGASEYDIPLKEKHGFGPLDRHCKYLAQDLNFTRRLYYVLKKELAKDPATERLFYELTMPVARMYADAEFNGVYVDPKKLKDAWKYWDNIEKEKLAELNRLVPDDRTRKNKKTKEIVVGINWNSAQQVADVLFNRFGLKPLEMTNGGKGEPKPSVSESVLLRLADKSPIPRLLLDYREAVKNKGTFVEGWMKRCYDNRMHPTFKVHGTVTGRPSCEEPNLQQTPRDARLRSLITAPPGWTLIDADLSQAELRITAEMSGDRELKLSYQTGVDVHTLTVQRIFGIMKPTKEERKKGKAINFGFVYGMGWKKFKDYARDNYGVDFTDAECKRIRKYFFRLYNGLPDWHMRQRRFANRNGYVRSIIGRKRRLPEAQLTGSDPHTEMRKAEAERQAINSPVQSLASDINLLATVQLHREFGETDYFRMIGTIHDAILMEIRDDMVDTVLPRVKQAMEWPDKFNEWDIRMSVPIIAEIEWGPWGAGTVWEPNK